jgi:hypothetical protein
VLRGVPAARLSSAGNGASFSAFRQRTRVRLLPALRFSSGGTPKTSKPSYRKATKIPADPNDSNAGSLLSPAQPHRRRLPARLKYETPAAFWATGAFFIYRKLP